MTSWVHRNQSINRLSVHRGCNVCVYPDGCCACICWVWLRCFTFFVRFALGRKQQHTTCHHDILLALFWDKRLSSFFMTWGATDDDRLFPYWSVWVIRSLGGGGGTVVSSEYEQERRDVRGLLQIDTCFAMLSKFEKIHSSISHCNPDWYIVFTAGNDAISDKKVCGL